MLRSLIAPGLLIKNAEQARVRVPEILRTLVRRGGEKPAVSSRGSLCGRSLCMVKGAGVATWNQTTTSLRSFRILPYVFSLGFKARGELMRALRGWLVRNRESMIDTVVAENGKTREDALLAELFYLADSIGFWAKRAEQCTCV